MPALRQRRVKISDVYCEPLSLLDVDDGRAAWPS